MYVAPRPAGVSSVVFAARWRAHARLAIADDAWRAAASWYEFWHPASVEGEPLQRAAAVALRAPEELGGICAVKFRDADSLGRRLADPAFAEMLYEDELVAFGRRLDHDLFPVTEHVVLDREPPALIVLGTVHRRPDLTAEQFAIAWKAAGRRLVELERFSNLACRYRQNVVAVEAAYDGIFELGFRTIEDVNDYMSRTAGSDHEAAEDGFVDREKTIRFLGRSEILHRA